MPASNTAEFPAGTLTEEALQVDCYVRSAVPGPIAETIDTVIERLQCLCDHGFITDYEVAQWPPEQHALARSDTASGPTRDELVTEFKRWAEQHGQSLEPAFRREEVPTSPLGLGPGEPRERVRVPLVALALYEVESTAETPPDSGPLHGVVPYTDRSHAGTEQTYTVDEWLSTVENRL